MGNNRSERDSQVLQRVQAREGLLGHRADLVPLQEPGRKENPTGQPDQVQPGWAGGHAAAVGNSQPLQLLQGGERPVHVFDGPGDLVLLEVPVDRHRDTTLLKRSRRHDVNKTLCGFTFRVKCSGYSKQLWDQRGVLCGAVAAFLCRLKNVFYGDYTAV